MRQLQTGQPQKLRLIGTMEGGAEVERLLHEQFAEFRTNGEWFAGPPSFRWFLGFMCEQKLPWQFVRAYALLDAWREEVLSELTTKSKTSNISPDVAWRDRQISRQHRQHIKSRDHIQELEAEITRLKELIASPPPNNAYVEPFEPAFYA